MRSEWIQPLQEEESSSFLESLGLQDFDRSFTSSYAQNLTDAAAIGINRESEPTMNDGGLYALPTGTPPLLIDEWERVPEGKRVIIGAFGGTNWITEIGEKSSSDLAISRISNEAIPMNQRSSTVPQFVNLMADHLEKGLILSDGKIDAVAISLGFGHQNKVVDYGIEARFITPQSSRGWKREDFNQNLSANEQLPLAEALIQNLHQRGFEAIKKVFFQNDTNAVTHDLTPDTSRTIPLGFVFGTGSNAAISQFNLESSLYPFPEDEIFHFMKEMSLVPYKSGVSGAITGGDAVRFRIASALALAGNNGIIDPDHAAHAYGYILNHGESTSSDIAMGDIPTLNALMLEGSEATLAQKIASQSLRQAGQIIGATIGAIASLADLDDKTLSVPVEGSFFWKGHGVKESAEETIQHIKGLPTIKIIEGSSIRGMGKLGLARS